MTALDADVLICGGGLAGLTLALQLRQEFPDDRITVIERSRRPLPIACHKVGESSVELGSQYLERLGLGEYLRAEHIIKMGLRFFPGGGHLPLTERAEIGASQEPIVRSYQLDRGKLEEDLRGMIEARGVTLIEGAKVKSIELTAGDEPNAVTFECDGNAITLRSRWLVDASGRSALIKRRLKLARGARHLGHAGWFRVEGRVELADLVPDRADPWHQRPMAAERWRSTNHLMGRGYWVWLIPLSSGRTSVGVVTHGEVHGIERVHSLEASMDFIREFEPFLAARLEHAQVLDFRCQKDYSHGVARSWSTDHWGIVGEAGAFVDPLYSPGTDFIAYANSFTTELIRVDRAGEDLVRRTGELNAQYRALVAGSHAVFRNAAPLYGHARGMATKIYWDNFVYWNFACQYFLQGMYRVTGPLYGEVSTTGARYVELSGYMQAALRAWAELAPQDRPVPGFVGLPKFPSMLVDSHLDLRLTMSHTETLEYMRMRLVQAEAIFVELMARMLMELGPELGAELLTQAEVSRWNLEFDPSRAAVEVLPGLDRRHSLSLVARDVERNLGRATLHPQWQQALALLPTAVQASPAAVS